MGRRVSSGTPLSSQRSAVTMTHCTPNESGSTRMITGSTSVQVQGARATAALSGAAPPCAIATDPAAVGDTAACDTAVVTSATGGGDVGAGGRTGGGSAGGDTTGGGVAGHPGGGCCGPASHPG